MRRVALVVSIDTEEDQWTPSRTVVTTRNLRELPAAHQMLRSLKLRPTWFTAWSAASDPWFRDYLSELHSSGEAEIGGHLHPWNTPPETEPLGGRHTMLSNLDPELQRRKLERLTEALTLIRGTPPASFRAGRWGLGATTAQVLIDCGYTVDSSVMPHVSWESECEGPSFVGAPTEIYRMSPAVGVTRRTSNGALVEVPVSVGFTPPGPQALWARLQRLLWRPKRARAALSGVVWRTGLIRKVLLSPETSAVSAILRAARRLIDSGASHLHMFWHSQSHSVGLNPFVPTRAMRDQFHNRIARFVDELSRFVEIDPMTVAEAAKLAPAPTQKR